MGSCKRRIVCVDVGSEGGELLDQLAANPLLSRGPQRAATKSAIVRLALITLNEAVRGVDVGDLARLKRLACEL
jgi:hypothetical protein